MGRKVITHREHHMERSGNEIRIDVSGLRRGIYVVSDGNGIFEKLILQ